jgi:hypothetical protein
MSQAAFEDTPGGGGSRKGAARPRLVTLRRGLSICAICWRGKMGFANVEHPTGGDMTLDIFDLLILVGDMMPPQDPNDNDDEDDDDEADDDREPAVIENETKANRARP